jgi:small subunit ribosomal protein S6
VTHELVVIVRVSETVEASKDKIKEILQKYGVTIVSENPWGVKRLAYEIMGERDGYYLLLNIEAPSEAIQKVTNEFRLNSDMLRHLFIKIEKKKSA